MSRFDRRYPCVADMERAAFKALPRFVRDYLFGGLGEELALARNRSRLQSVTLTARYLSEADRPDMAARILGHAFDAPFAIAPLGLAGLIWPDCEIALARAARDGNVGHVLSTYSNRPLEDIAPIVGQNGWFQYYPPNDAAMGEDLIRRAKKSGYHVLVVTVDIPAPTRRERDIRNGMSIPPVFDLATLADIALHPRWALSTLQTGIPDFGTLSPYYPPGATLSRSAEFLGRVMEGHITAKRFATIRKAWDGPVIVKGVIDCDEAALFLEMGADGIIVSNHGGRQFDAAPSAAEILPAMRARLGPEALIMADGGIRSGLDIIRMLALGADFVLIGRPFLFASAAMGANGGAHLIDVLKAEIRAGLAQMGAANLSELPRFLWSPDRNHLPASRQS